MTRLEDLLIKHEGIKLHAYQDHLGYWTIGVGRLIDQRRGGGITEQEAIMLLTHDILKASKQCYDNMTFWPDLNEVRQDALINLCFNLGITGLLGFKNTLKAIAEKRWEDAEAGLRKSKWATQVQKERVEDICHMIRTGEYR